MQPDYPTRYARQLRLKGFGPQAQQKLSNAKVLVVGAGGLGVSVLQYLAGMGVGTIGIVDDDSVSLSNLHRQVLYNTGDIGKFKADVAEERLRQLNPGLTFTVSNRRLSPDSAIGIIENFDIVVDATDNFAARYLINDACVMLHKPFVYGAVQDYEGHVSVFNFEGGPTYRCLYPSPPDPSSIPDCNEAGVLGVVPGIVGSMQALQVVKIITGIGSTLSGTLLVFDFLQDEQYRMRLKANPENQQIGVLQADYARDSCVRPQHHLSPAILQQWLKEEKRLVLIDVREPHEFEQSHIQSAQNIPLAALITESNNFHPETPVILYCQKGGRSAEAYSWLQKTNPQLELFELAGGFEAWNNQ